MAVDGGGPGHLVIQSFGHPVNRLPSHPVVQSSGARRRITGRDLAAQNEAEQLARILHVQRQRLTLPLTRELHPVAVETGRSVCHPLLQVELIIFHASPAPPPTSALEPAAPGEERPCPAPSPGTAAPQSPSDRAADNADVVRANVNGSGGL